MGGRFWVAATLGLVVARVASAAPSMSVGFGRPAESDYRRAQLCLAELCGELDEDGTLPIVVAAPPGSVVWVGDALATSTFGGFVARVDPLTGMLHRRLADLEAPPRELRVAVRVEGPALAAERTLELTSNDAMRRLLERRIALLHGGALAWAADHDPARQGVHPTVVVPRWVVGGRESMFSDLGRRDPPWVIPDDPGLEVRDLELVAVVRITPTLLERCRRCALGDFAWPEVEFRCARVRLDSEVTVFEAKSGRSVATRTFQGPSPGPCGDNVDHLQVRGANAPELRDWLRHDVARLPR